MDRTLIEARASIRSFRRKDGSDSDPDGTGRNAERGFHKEKRSNDTHQSMSGPQARLYKKGDGQLAKLCSMGHALMENRHGLVVGSGVTQATGKAERAAALAMFERRTSRRRIMPGTDTAYDVGQFVKDLCDRNVTPHIAADGPLRVITSRNWLPAKDKLTHQDWFGVPAGTKRYGDRWFYEAYYVLDVVPPKGGRTDCSRGINVLTCWP